MSDEIDKKKPTFGLHEFEAQKLNDKMGIEAQVERHEANGEIVNRANGALTEIGEFIHKNAGDAALRSCDYVGSTAVHIFQSQVLGQFFFLTQCGPIGATPEWTANEAFKQLRGDLMAHYGRKRPTSRSGV